MLQSISTKTIMNSCISACKSIPVKRVAAFLGMFLFCAVMTFAQSKGAGGFQKAITEVSSYQTPVSNLMKAIAAVIALVGAFSIYFKMQNGDQYLLQNAERRSGREEGHHAHYRRLCSFPCNERGFTFVLQVVTHCFLQGVRPIKSVGPDTFQL